MRTTIDFKNKLTMISEMTNESKFQVLEFEKLKGGNSIDAALKIQSINETEMRLKQVRILLKESCVKLEKGALSYLKGEISVGSEKNSKVKDIGKKLLGTKFLDDEDEDSLIMYYGTGEIFLEPSFNNYVFIKLEDEEIIISEGMLIACEDTVYVEEAEYEIKLSREGIVVLELPVPEEEVFKCKLHDDILKVDGELVVLRSGTIDLRRQKINSAGKEEEEIQILNIYSGKGELWLIPTKNIYDDIDE